LREPADLFFWALANWSGAKSAKHTAQEAFAAACDAGEADAAALLLECDGIDGNAAVDLGYARPYDAEEDPFVHNDEGDEEGDTVLTRVARRGTSDVVRALVTSGKVDVDGAGPNGGLSLVLACPPCARRPRLLLAGRGAE